MSFELIVKIVIAILIVGGPIAGVGIGFIGATALHMIAEERTAEAQRETTDDLIKRCWSMNGKPVLDRRFAFDQCQLGPQPTDEDSQ